MTQRSTVPGIATQVGQGVLAGVLLGLVTGAIEFAMVVDAFSSDLVHAYWKVLGPYAVLGLLAGLVVPIGLRVIFGSPVSPARGAARVVGWLAGLIVFCLLSVWATYWLGSPMVKLSNLAAYVGAVLAGGVTGVVLQRVLAALLGRVETMLDGSRVPFHVAWPAAIGVLAALVLFAPTAYLSRVHSVSTVSAGTVVARADDRPNVLFIVIDALRADHLPTYGYSRQTAPTLAALARQGAVFTQAYAQASYTRASVATILTSLYPSVHKANDDRDFLSSSVVVLPEVMRAAGYATFGISSNANVSPTFGYSRGFDEFRVWKTESEFRLTLAGRALENILGPSTLGHLLRESSEIVPTADAITDATLGWASPSARQPFFMYVHYIDPHDPYRPPAPYDAAFDHRKDPPRRGDVDVLSLLPNTAERERIARNIDQYDGEILYADQHVGRLLKVMEERGLLRNTLVIVTADHGEEFLDHGNEIHGRSAYEEVVRVPLILVWPGRIKPGTVTSSMVGHIDVMPTLAELAGTKAPAGAQGRSYAPLLRDFGTALEMRPMLTQVIQKAFTIEAIRDGRYKYVHHARGPRAGQEEIYDLEQDPLERKNLATEARARTASLKKSLDAFN